MKSTKDRSLVKLESKEYKRKGLPTRWPYYGIWGFDGGFGKYLFCVGGILKPGVILRLRQESDDWSASLVEAPFQMRGVWGASLSQLFAIGDEGAIFFSCDGGDTWEQRRSPDEKSCWYRMTGDKDSRLWLCGDNGRLLSSSDLGLSWTEQQISKERLLSIHRTENGALLVGTFAGEIFTSHDDGASWRTAQSGTKQPINHIWSDSKTLYAACDGGLFLSSTDQQRWSNERPFLAKVNIESGSATLEGNVYLLGSNGAVLHRPLGGEWETLAKASDAGWWASHSFDDRSTYLCGDDGKLSEHTPGEPLQPLSLHSR